MVSDPKTRSLNEFVSVHVPHMTSLAVSVVIETSKVTNKNDKPVPTSTTIVFFAVSLALSRA